MGILMWEDIMTLRSLVTSLAAASLLALAPVVLRADESQPPNMPQGKEWCEKNPEKCADMRRQREEWCQKHPDECQKMKQKREERKEWCDKNPQECAKQREERRKKLEEMKAKCDADPAKCEQRKEEMREEMKKRQEGAQGQRGKEADGTKPPKP
jgi:hypothetical protein